MDGAAGDLELGALRGVPEFRHGAGVSAAARALAGVSAPAPAPAPVTAPVTAPIPVTAPDRAGHGVMMRQEKGLALGRVLGDDGTTCLLTDADLALLGESGAEVVRLELRLTRAHQHWDDALLASYQQ